MRAHYVEVGTPRDPDRDAVVHEELNRLPEKYRAPLVLCDLEGRTHQEAARFLGWPIGTVKSRQSQGRELLRDRLLRRGLGLAVAGALVESLRQSAVAAMPREVSRNTVNAAMQQSARLLTGLRGFGTRSFTHSRSPSSHVVDQTSIPRGRDPCGRDRVRRGERLRTWLSGAGAEGRTASLEGAERPRTDQAPQPRSRSQRRDSRWTAELRVRLRAQQLATRKAKAAYEIAKLTRELAEIAVEEYEEVIYPGTWPQSRVKSSSPNPTWSAPNIASTGPSGCSRRSTSRRPRRPRRSCLSRNPSSPSSSAEQEKGPGGIHQEQDHQGASERGREGPRGRTGQGGDLGPGEGQRNRTGASTPSQDELSRSRMGNLPRTYYGSGRLAGVFSVESTGCWG